MSWSRSDPPHPSLKAIPAQIYQLLANHPNGLDLIQIRQLLALGPDDAQEQLDRRVRDLRSFYKIDVRRAGPRHIYVLIGPKEGGETDAAAITGKLRAHVLHLAFGRCQMCGKTVSEDGVKLHADHKIPRTWGGLTAPENLWAICEQCNNGKRDYFSSFNFEAMKDIIARRSVHERIAFFLKQHMRQPVPSRLIEFIANATERQEDWQKRLRELRYPCIGLVIKSGRRKTAFGYIESTYELLNWRDLPSDHVKQIKEHEKQTKKANSASENQNG